MDHNEKFSSEDIKPKARIPHEYSLYVDSNGVLSPINFVSETDAKPYVDTLIVSDIHLGSPVSRPKELLVLLKHYSFRQLILNGDIFDNLNIRRFCESDWEILRYLRNLLNNKKMKVIWVIGNHDGDASLLSNLLGIRIYQEYEWTYSSKKIIVIHGHQFDNFLQKHTIISDFSSWLYYLIQRFDGKKKFLSRFIKRTSKSWLNISHKIGLQALDYARERGKDVVICGHTHQAYCQSDGSVTYYNSGCWTDVPSHYITIDTINGITVNGI